MVMGTGEDVYIGLQIGLYWSLLVIVGPNSSLCEQIDPHGYTIIPNIPVKVVPN